MRFAQPLDQLLGQQSKVKIMRFLIKSGAELAGREIARSVGLAQRNTHTALMDLWRQGIVNMRRVGKAKLYKINKDSLFAAKAIIPLFAFEGSLLDRLSASIVHKIRGPVVSLVIFGSIAEEKERPDSDIDLLIIIKENASIQKVDSTLDEISLSISRKFGNFLSPIILKENQFRRRYKQGDRLIKNIVKRGKVIYGHSFMEMLYA